MGRSIKITKESNQIGFGKLEVGTIIQDNEPYTGFNTKDGTFTVCFGMGMYFDLQPDEFVEINELKSEKL